MMAFYIKNGLVSTVDPRGKTFEINNYCEFNPVVRASKDFRVSR
jgi:hypothetical protein